MTPEERNYLAKQLGLSGGSPARQRAIANAKRPKSYAGPRRKRRKSLGQQISNWWKDVTKRLRPGRAVARSRKRRRAKKAAKGAEFGPVVQAFLAGQSVRQAVYLNRFSDPAVMTAKDWPDQLAAGEAAIRASLLYALEQLQAAQAEQR